jgi:hypothetical protein
VVVNAIQRNFSNSEAVHDKLKTLQRELNNVDATIIAQHIAGHSNVQADELSRITLED